MGWNYRVLRWSSSRSEPHYEIREVYYNRETKRPESHCRATVGDDTRDGILKVLAMMADALGQPVLDAEKLEPIEPEKVLTDNLAGLLKRVMAEEEIPDSSHPTTERGA